MSKPSKYPPSLFVVNDIIKNYWNSIIFTNEYIKALITYCGKEIENGYIIEHKHYFFIYKLQTYFNGKIRENENNKFSIYIPYNLIPDEILNAQYDERILMDIGGEFSLKEKLKYCKNKENIVRFRTYNNEFIQEYDLKEFIKKYEDIFLFNKFYCNKVKKYLETKNRDYIKILENLIKIKYKIKEEPSIL